MAETNTAIDRATLDQWSAPYRNWHYWPNHVIPAEPKISGHEDFKNTDAPCVYDIRREAQELVYDAWEAADTDEVFNLLSRAVELDPANVDAWIGLMDFEPLEDEERIEILRKLVAMGEKNLGTKIFQEDKGHFWGLLETRPYMRARSQLALHLMELGRFEESMAEHESMLELNPNDNQGVRYGLMACYLAVSRLDGARRLFKQYNERKYSAPYGIGRMCWSAFFPGK